MGSLLAALALCLAGAVGFVIGRATAWTDVTVAGTTPGTERRFRVRGAVVRVIALATTDRSVRLVVCGAVEDTTGYPWPKEDADALH